MSRLFARLHAWSLAGEDRGQATTEYALVMLGAAVIALLVVGRSEERRVGKECH